MNRLRVLEAKAAFMDARHQVLAALGAPGEDPTGALCDAILAADELCVERLARFAKAEARSPWMDDFMRGCADGDGGEAR